jgi:hypothetical protein
MPKDIVINWSFLYLVLRYLSLVAICHGDIEKGGCIIFKHLKKVLKIQEAFNIVVFCNIGHAVPMSCNLSNQFNL